MHEGGSLVPRPSHTAAKNSCEGRPGYEAGGGEGAECRFGVHEGGSLVPRPSHTAAKNSCEGRPGYEAGGGGGRGQNVGLVCMRGVASYPGLPTQLQKIAVREGLGTRLGGGGGRM